MLRGQRRGERSSSGLSRRRGQPAGHGTRARKRPFYSGPCDELAVCPWAGHFPSLSLSFLILQKRGEDLQPSAFASQGAWDCSSVCGFRFITGPLGTSRSGLGTGLGAPWPRCSEFQEVGASASAVGTAPPVRMGRPRAVIGTRASMCIQTAASAFEGSSVFSRWI